MRPPIPLFCLFLAAPLAAFHRANLGGYAGILDRMGAGVAELALGNTATARMEAVPAAYWNPAVLTFTQRPLVSAGADMRALNRNGGHLAVQGRVAPNLAVGLGIVNRGDYNVEVRDRNEKVLGTARPQEIASYLGVGFKTSRRTGWGLTLQWFHSNFDLGGPGDANVIGIVNAGWFRYWGQAFQSAVVVRNLGLNSRLSADYELVTQAAQSPTSLDRSGRDFFPKTFVAAGVYRLRWLDRPLSLSMEFLDFQLANSLMEWDMDKHAMGLRAGAEWKWFEVLDLRLGVDRTNLAAGFGTRLFAGKGREVRLNYAVLLERGFLTFNPFAVDLRMAF